MREIAGKRPRTLITDGVQNYRDAFTKEFWMMHGTRRKHVRDIRFGGEVHNNKMKAMNGEVKDRERSCEV